MTPPAQARTSRPGGGAPKAARRLSAGAASRSRAQASEQPLLPYWVLPSAESLPASGSGDHAAIPASSPLVGDAPAGSLAKQSLALLKFTDPAGFSRRMAEFRAKLPYDPAAKSLDERSREAAARGDGKGASR